MYLEGLGQDDWSVYTDAPAVPESSGGWEWPQLPEPEGGWTSLFKTGLQTWTQYDIAKEQQETQRVLAQTLSPIPQPGRAMQPYYSPVAVQRAQPMGLNMGMIVVIGIAAVAAIIMFSGNK